MLTQRWRPVVWAGAAVLVIWGLAVVGYRLAKGATVTSEKVRLYVEGTNLRKLSGADRARAIKRLEDMINHLSMEERRRARFERAAADWFEAMTEEEKAEFLEATMPTGFKQMLTAFEELPEEKRRRAVEDAVKRLKESQKKMAAEGGNFEGTNPPVTLSPELEAKVRTMGLKAFYSQSSAQTKAELAPVMEELQRVMESGRPMRR